MSNMAFSGILQGSLTVTFLIQQYSYCYITNATTDLEYNSVSSSSCKDRSDPMQSIGEKEGSTEVNFRPQKCHIVYIRHVPHAFGERPCLVAMYGGVSLKVWRSVNEDGIRYNMSVTL